MNTYVFVKEGATIRVRATSYTKALPTLQFYAKQMLEDWKEFKHVDTIQE